MDNTYTPSTTRTVYPDVDHLRTTPNYTRIDDKERIKFFSNWNADKIQEIRTGKGLLNECDLEVVSFNKKVYIN
jgi:hypothetical protein